MAPFKKIHICTVSYLAIVLLVGFIWNKITQNAVLCIFCVTATIVLPLILKKRSVYELPKRQVSLVMAAIATIIIASFFISGLKFGFYKVNIPPSYIWAYVLPYGIAIISSELARSIFLAEQSKASRVISYFSFVTVDIIILSDLNIFSRFDNLIGAIGLAVLPAVTSNVLYHYISTKYGAWPNVAYKLAIFLFPYIIPYRPQTSDVIVSFARIFLPIGILLLIRALYTPRGFVVARRKKRLQHALSCVFIVLSVFYIMLVSSQFKYKMLVIATDSMSGTIDKGDAIIYEEYSDHTIEVGDVIVFEQDEQKIIHRVIEIKKINGEMRYFTMGDANDSADSGYITDKDIVGIINSKIKYIGYPTIWVRSLFK